MDFPVSTARKAGMLYTPEMSTAAEQGELESSPRADHVFVTRGFCIYYYDPLSPALCKPKHVVAFLVIISSFPAAAHALSSDVRGSGETPKKRGRKTMHEERRRTLVYPDIDYRCEDRKMVGELRGVVVPRNRP
jgi:hypothetical protein